MQTTKYKYSKGQMIGDLAILFFLTGLFYMITIARNPGHEPWFLFSGILLIILARLTYLAVMYFIPCLKDKTALELDSDKLQLFITGKLLFQVPRDIAYWKDIENIEYITPPRGSPIICFRMNDGSSFGFYTKYIAGDSNAIYNKIMEYFRNR